MDRFETLDEFVDWYTDNGYPVNSDGAYDVVEVDDASAVVLYREGRYQVELYILLGNTHTPDHAHPNLETMFLTMDDRSNRGHRTYDVIPHGNDFFGRRLKSVSIMVAQRWDDGIPITSAAIQWLGYTAGPKHDRLIASYYPDAIVKRGFADVRRDKGAKCYDPKTNKPYIE